MLCLIADIACTLAGAEDLYSFFCIKKVCTYLISWTYADKLHTFYCIIFLFFQKVKQKNFFIKKFSISHLEVLHALGQLVSNPLQLVGTVIHLSESIQNLLCLRIGLLGAVYIVMRDL